MLRCHEDCAAGSAFHTSNVAGKETALAEFLKHALDRINFSCQKNSVGQKVPENWRELLIQNVKNIRELFAKEKVDIVVNADQCFIRFYPEGQKGRIYMHGWS
jgi:hypothetical protein